MPAAAFAQAQAAIGNFEGTVRDATGAVVPGVTITVVNTELGTRRVVVTSDQGFYRAPLLPLGTYTVTADMQGFRKFEQRNLTLAPGQTVIANIQLEVGGMEVVPVATCRSSRAIPTISPSCTPTSRADENNESDVPRINANGSQQFGVKFLF